MKEVCDYRNSTFSNLEFLVISQAAVDFQLFRSWHKLPYPFLSTNPTCDSLKILYTFFKNSLSKSASKSASKCNACCIDNSCSPVLILFQRFYIVFSRFSSMVWIVYCVQNSFTFMFPQYQTYLRISSPGNCSLSTLFKRENILEQFGLPMDLT